MNAQQGYINVNGGALTLVCSDPSTPSYGSTYFVGDNGTTSNIAMTMDGTGKLGVASLVNSTSSQLNIANGLFVDSFQKSSSAASVPLFQIGNAGGSDVSASVIVEITQATQISGIANYSEVYKAIFYKPAGGSWVSQSIFDYTNGTPGSLGAVTNTVANQASTLLEFGFIGNGSNLAAINLTVKIQATMTNGTGGYITPVYSRL